MKHRARPRDAASLVITRGRGRDLAVLMGRRPPRDRFMPDVWVFPGGRVESDDERSEALRPLPRAVARGLEARWSPARVRALATAAIRETWEETGLAVGDVRDDTLRPDHAALLYLGRAITPTVSAIRYHARFFTTTVDATSGRLRGNGELIDLAWWPIARALELPVIDVTIEMLRQVERMDARRVRPPSVFVHYHRGEKRVRHE